MNSFLESPKSTVVALHPFKLVSQILLGSVLTCAGLAGAVEPADPSRTTAPGLALDLNFESDDWGGQAIGKLTVNNTGPNGEFFKGLPRANRALEFRRPGSYLRILDSEHSSQLDFEQGDSITLEAWVRVDSITPGGYAYIIGKGRTYESGPRENHNYAMRLAGSGGTAKLSFLFSTRQPAGALKYHRWTTKQGFAVDGMWHHVAISYQFGDPQKVRGYIDGQSRSGVWDMGGATKLPPVVDDDSLWVGSSRGGAAANSLVGAVDDVRLHRRRLAPEEFKSRRVVIPQIPRWPDDAGANVSSEVLVTLHEGAPSHTAFPMRVLPEAYRFSLPKLALHRLPQKYSAGGQRESWKGPVWLRAFVKTRLVDPAEVSETPNGSKIELLMRSPGRSRLWIDGQVVLETPARRLFPDAHQPFEVYQPDLPWLRVPRVGDREERTSFVSDGSVHEVVLESLVGSEGSRCETGETLVAVRGGAEMFTLLGPPLGNVDSLSSVALVDREFLAYRDGVEAQLGRLDRQRLAEESARENAFWERRHRLARAALRSTWPPQSFPLDDSQRGVIDQLIAKAGGEHPQQRDGNSMNQDLAFLRRLSLDTVGVPPTLAEIDQFRDTPAKLRRAQAITRLLADDRWADHWTSYWQDVLAENPSILKPSLNNTGPFRYWIHDSLLLNKPMDRFVTELVRMDGGKYAGAPAGFAMATQNDVPMAEKAHVVASAFLAVDMKCARCHDAPYHPWTQRDLFHIGALLNQEAIEVPQSSSVPLAFFDRKGRDSPIQVTLKPGEQVAPEWPQGPFAAEEFGPNDLSPELVRPEASPRERLAARITRGENRRFARVIANRLWTRMMGWGLMPSTEDWYEADPRHPELLDYLARELVQSGYDLKHVFRLIAQSQTYQRPPIDDTRARGQLVFSAPWQRRLSAEQVVDSLHTVTGVALATEPVTFDPEGSQKIQNFLNLGVASRAWQLASLSNERDRPSLSLPKAAAVVECLQAFGWRASRQSPQTHRESEANLVQPGVVANGPMTTWVSRLTNASGMTQLALRSDSPESFVESIFLAILTRPPTDAEREAFVAPLADGFAGRKEVTSTALAPPASRGFVTWSNHFSAGANQLMREVEQEVVAGPQPTARLTPAWRERAEDAIWALLNSPEFQWIP